MNQGSVLPADIIRLIALATNCADTYYAVARTCKQLYGRLLKNKLPLVGHSNHTSSCTTFLNKLHGELHRWGKLGNRGEHYYMGTLHNEHGAAYYDGNKDEYRWYRFGKLHRENGLPAVESPKRREYWVNGVRHCDEGDKPAVMKKNRHMYYCDGVLQKTCNFSMIWPHFLQKTWQYYRPDGTLRKRVIFEGKREAHWFFNARGKCVRAYRIKVCYPNHKCEFQPVLWRRMNRMRMECKKCGTWKYNF